MRSDDEEEVREGEGAPGIENNSYMQQKNHSGRPSLKRSNPDYEYREGK